MTPQTPQEWAFVIVLALFLGAALLRLCAELLQLRIERRFRRAVLAARYRDAEAGETR